MKIFSEENLANLIDEYELISKTVGRLASTSEGRNFAQRFGQDVFTATIIKLRVEKACLEAKIETLQEFIKSQ